MEAVISNNDGFADEQHERASFNNLSGKEVIGWTERKK